MKYYILSPCYPDDSLSVTGNESNDYGVNRTDARQCKLLNDSYLSAFKFRVNQTGKEYGLLANNLGWYLVSSEIKQVLQGICFPDEIQFLAFSLLKNANLPECQDYYLMNVIKRIDCLDLDRSSLNYDFNDVGRRYISSVYELCLRSGFIAGRDNIFRVHGLELYLIVSEKIVREMSKLNLVGYSFSQVKTSS